LVSVLSSTVSPYLEGTMDIDMNNEFTYERITDRIGGMESHERVS